MAIALVVWGEFTHQIEMTKVKVFVFTVEEVLPLEL